MKCLVRCLVGVALVALVSAARANTLFVDLPSPTGVYEWDVFDPAGVVGYAGPHAPDVRGTGDATISVTHVMLPPIQTPGGPVQLNPQVTSGFDLYAGNSIPTHTVNLSNATATDSETTLVLQLAVASTSNLASSALLLNGTTTPTEFLVRGLGGPGNNTKYLWAEWQTAAATNYSITFSAGPHFTIRGAQLEYLNSASVYDAPTPAFIPEPASGGMAATGLLGLAGWARRRRSAS